jgi:anti-sigma factor RsiW
MQISDEMLCKELLLDIIHYEMRRGNLSPEMRSLFERHLKECPSCRRSILGFQNDLHGTEVVRNFG